MVRVYLDPFGTYWYIDLGRLSWGQGHIYYIAYGYSLSVYEQYIIHTAFSTFAFFVGFHFIMLFPITRSELLLKVEKNFIAGILVASLVKQCPNQLMSLLKSWQLLDGYLCSVTNEFALIYVMVLMAFYLIFVIF